MRESGKKNTYILLTVLVLFCVFASVFLLLVSAGGGVYKKTVSRMDESYEIRTTLSYVAGKVRSAPGGDVRVTEQNGRNVLEIADAAQNEEYATYIYFDGGSLRELYQKKGKELQLELGEEIVKTGRVDIGLQNGLLTVSMETSGGTDESITVYLPYAGGEGA
jgi:hypothetical protein